MISTKHISRIYWNPIDFSDFNLHFPIKMKGFCTKPSAVDLVQVTAAVTAKVPEAAWRFFRFGCFWWFNGYHLVMTNSLPWNITIFKFGKASISMGHFPWLCWITSIYVVSWDDYIFPTYGKIKFIFQTTNQNKVPFRDCFLTSCWQKNFQLEWFLLVSCFGSPYAQ